MPVSVDKDAIFETFHINRETANAVIDQLRAIVQEGTARRITVKNAEGITLIEVPLAMGLAGAVFAPIWAAVGAVAAIATDCTITVERRPDAAAPAATHPTRQRTEAPKKPATKATKSSVKAR